MESVIFKVRLDSGLGVKCILLEFSVILSFWSGFDFGDIEVKPRSDLYWHRS